MKKMLFACGVAAMMGLGLASCGGGSSAADSAFTDSLSTTLGQFNGAQLGQQFNMIPQEQRAKFDKREILNAIKTIVMTDTSRQSYVTGLQIGMQLWGQLYQMESSGVQIDRKALYDAYAKAFMADSIPADELEAIGRENQKLMGRANEIMVQKRQEQAEAEKKARAESPEAKKNEEGGAAFIAGIKKDNPDAQTTESGLVYKVNAKGTGANPTTKDQVRVKYTGRHIDGSEFDSSESAVFPVTRVIPGFSEGLMLMNKGANYTLYIPGNLAYGVDGTPDGKIGPNETLVFDVEVLEIISPE